MWRHDTWIGHALVGYGKSLAGERVGPENGQRQDTARLQRRGIHDAGTWREGGWRGEGRILRREQ